MENTSRSTVRGTGLAFLLCLLFITHIFISFSLHISLYIILVLLSLYYVFFFNIMHARICFSSSLFRKLLCLFSLLIKRGGRFEHKVFFILCHKSGEHYCRNYSEGGLELFLFSILEASERKREKCGVGRRRVVRGKNNIHL